MEIENGHNTYYSKIIDEEMKRDSTRLTYIPFGVRLQNKFKELNLFTVGDIIHYPLKNLLEIKGFGKISYWKTMGILADKDIYHAKDWVDADKKEDMINHPKHYVRGDIAPIDFINANKLDYLEGNIIKYVSRYKFKNGLEDLLKAQFYINMLIEREQDK